MALSVSALTTLATAKTELSLTVTTYDAYIERLIESASSFIASSCSRTFERADDISEKVAGYGGVLLAVERIPLIAITSVAYDGEAIDSAGYEIHSKESGEIYGLGGWRWTAKTKDDASGANPDPGTERKLYTIVYDGGYVTPNQVDLTLFATRSLPYDLEDACVQLVVSRYHRRGEDKNVSSEKILSGSVSYFGESVPQSIQDIISRYMAF